MASIAGENSRAYASDRMRGWLAVRLGLSVLLILAAVLKIADLLSAQRDGLLVSLIGPRAVYVVIMSETCLALWLLSGWWGVHAWRAALLAFSCFFVFVIGLAISGYRSCGCFGAWEFNPWLTAAVDAIGVVSLVLFRPRGAELSLRRGTSPRNWLSVCLLGLGLLGILAIVTLIPPPFLASIRGERIVSGVAIYSVGEGKPREDRTVRVTLVNTSDRAVSVFGMRPNCVCKSAKGLPVTIGGHSKAIVPVIVQFGANEGKFATRAEFYTDAPGEAIAVCRLRGTVRKLPN